MVASALLRSSKMFLFALGYSETPSIAVAKGSVTCIVINDFGIVESDSYNT